MLKRNLVLAITLLSVHVGLAQAGDFLSTDFSKADSIAFLFSGRDLQHPDLLAKELVKGLTTDQEKFRVLFRWITDNISYDYPLYLKIIRKESQLKFDRKRKSAFATRASKEMYRNMILKKETICGGYAMLLEYMCHEVGLECNFISGYGRTFSNYATRGPNHAWNAVKLNNKWYLCDVTWASGYFNEVVERYRKEFSEAYFLTDPSLFIANHYPSDARWTLLKNPASPLEFSQSVFKGDGFIKNWINQYSPQSRNVRIKKTDSFELRFTSNAKVIDSAARVEIHKPSDKKYYKLIRTDLAQNKLGEYVLTIKFQESGTYNVYIYINDDVTFVYEVSVG
jgi:hypothetical protein